MAQAVKEAQRQDNSTSHGAGLLFSATFKVEKHHSKKNGWTIRNRGWRRNKLTGRAEPIKGIGATAEATAAEQFLVLHLQRRARDVDLREPISVPVHVLFVLQLDNLWAKPKRKRDPPRINLRSGDISNLIQGPEDALQKAGIIVDDALIVSIEARKVSGPNAIKICIYQASQRGDEAL
jgi:Holliday junction resolvase RusA-like endonuclease